MRFQNYQLYYECQLVALWNAARFHKIKVPKIGGAQYRKICYESKAILGGCINIERERKRLGLVFMPGRIDLRWIRKNLPVHLAVFCHKGYHSVLVVDVDADDIITLVNYVKGTIFHIKWNSLKDKINKHSKPYSIVPVKQC